jgi:hypothetical protein
MECVAQGAALKAGRVIEPVVKKTPYGYGTVFPVAGRAPFFQTLIAPNSAYPVSGSISLLFLNPMLTRATFRLVSKEVDQKKSTAGREVWLYKELGEVSVSMTPSGDLPVVDVAIELSGERKLSLTLQHRQSRNSVKYVSLTRLDGKEIVAQEDHEPRKWTKDDVRRFIEAFKDKQGGWTEAHRERLLRVARRVLELAVSSSDGAVKEKADVLEELAESSQPGGECRSPNVDCPRLADRTKELLDALHAAGTIDSGQFLGHLAELTAIAEKD